MAELGPDRRKYSRVAAEDVISVAPVDLPDRLAVATDISVGGIRFQAMGCDIGLSDVLRVTFNVGDQTVVAVGRVAWATDIDTLTLDVGLEFIEIDALALRLLQERQNEPPA